MTQHTSSGRPSASGPPPTVGAIILRWLHDQDRTLAFLATTASIDADNIINILTGAIAPTSDQLDGLAQATGVQDGELYTAVAMADPPAPPDPLRAFTVSQVATRLQVSEFTVRREMDRGRLGYIVIGNRQRRIPSDALAERLDWRGGAR